MSGTHLNKFAGMHAKLVRIRANLPWYVPGLSRAHGLDEKTNC